MGRSYGQTGTATDSAGACCGRSSWMILPCSITSTRSALAMVSGRWATMTLVSSNALTASLTSRSFITSSRFEFNHRFAKEMFLRGTYLMRKLVAYENSGRPWDRFALPDGVLVY